MSDDQTMPWPATILFRDKTPVRVQVLPDIVDVHGSTPDDLLAKAEATGRLTPEDMSILTVWVNHTCARQHEVS